MKVKAFTVSEQALIDQRTNNLTLVNILDELHPGGFPAVLPRLVVVAVCERAPAGGDTERALLEIWQGRKKLLETPMEFSFQRVLRRNLLELVGFTLLEPGTLSFRLTQEGRKLAEYRIAVEAAAGPKAINR